MKKYFGSLLVFILLFFPSGQISASEGRIQMGNGDIGCEGISIWQGSSYRVLGRCQGLIYPYSEQLDQYYLWVRPQDGGDAIELTDVRTGIFEASADKQFRDVFITAERMAMPVSPGTVVLSGAIVPFGFPRTNTATVPGEILGSNDIPTPTPTTTLSLGVGSLFARSPFSVGGAIVIVVLVLLILGLVFFVRR